MYYLTKTLNIKQVVQSQKKRQLALGLTGEVAAVRRFYTTCFTQYPLKPLENMFNAKHGYAEAYVRGCQMKRLRKEQYMELARCDTVEDIKSYLVRLWPNKACLKLKSNE